MSLRRAVSSSYYALFHASARLCADSLIGQKPWPLYAPVYRALDHRKSLDVLKGSGTSVLSVGAIFKTLQNKRHEADYSPAPFSLNRSDILDLTDTAEQAIGILQNFTPDEKLALAIKLVVKSR